MSRAAPLISVITVVRNDVTGVIATLSSVFEQSLHDYEVIVQDGASTDGTTEALVCFGDWIDDLETAPDAGIYDAMNRALARARGDWVLFLNAGDVLVDRDVLHRVSGRLLARLDLFVGQAVRAEDGMVHDYLPREMFWAGSVNDHQASFVRREIAQELGFDARWRIVGDLDFFQRLRARGAREHFEEMPVVRKPFATGISTDFMARFHERAALLLDRYEGVHPVRDVLERNLRSYLKRTYDPPPGLLRAADYDQLLAHERAWRAAMTP